MGKRNGSGAGGPRKKAKKNFTIIEPGWSGIFVTCPRGKEPQCKGEITDLAQEYAEKLWPEAAESETDEVQGDIEDEIRREVEQLKAKKKSALVQGHLIDIECVVFVRTKAPIDPVQLVLEMCKDAVESGEKRTRYVQRLSPMSLLVHANIENIAQLQPLVAPHFEEKGSKFAIRPTSRNSQLPRDELITATARLVGEGHAVDLKNYDKLILVDSFKSVLGLGVVDHRFEEYSRFNLTHIYEKTVQANGDGSGQGHAHESPAKDEPKNATTEDPSPKTDANANPE